MIQDVAAGRSNLGNSCLVLGSKRPRVRVVARIDLASEANLEESLKTSRFFSTIFLLL